MTPTGPRPSRREFLFALLVLVVLATIPLWTLGWWTALPFAAAAGGLGRWSLAPLALVLAAGIRGRRSRVGPRARSRSPATPDPDSPTCSAPPRDCSTTVFLFLGPILFGLVAAVTAAALAGGLRSRATCVGQVRSRSRFRPGSLAGRALGRPRRRSSVYSRTMRTGSLA